MAYDPLRDPVVRAALEASEASLRASIAENRSAAARYAAQAEEDQAKLNALLVVLGKAPAGSGSPARAAQLSAPALPPPENTLGGRSSWSDLIFNSLDGLAGGLTYQEFIARAAGTPLAERFVKSPNAFYARVGKLEKAEKLIRRGKVFYLPETLAKIDAGEIIEDPPRDHEADAGGMSVLISRVLSDHPAGLKAGDVLAKLREVPEALERVNRNPQIVYATLGRMVQAKMASRDHRNIYTPYGVEPDAHSPTLRALWEGKPM